MYIRYFYVVLLSAALVLTASGNALAVYVLQDEIQLTIGGSLGTADVHRPAVAYNWLRKEYLGVYHSDLTSSGNIRISAHRVSPDGSDTYLGYVSTGDTSKNPDVAYDHHNDRNLIVWSQYNSGASRWEIYGKVIPWNQTPFLIAAWTGVHLEIPAVAFGYNPLTGIYRYMVVWQTSNVSDGGLQGIGYRMVSADGSVLGSAAWVDPGPNLGSPDVTYNIGTAEYLVVWAAPGGTSGIDIFGRRVDLYAFLQGSTFSVHSGPYNQQRPAVTTNTQHRYLVVWQHDYLGAGTDWDIRGQFLDVSGGTVGDVLTITETTDNETRPALAANGGLEEYFAVWQRETTFGKSIYGRLLYTDLTNKNPFEIAPPALGDNEDPAVGSHSAGYFITYTWDSFDPTTYGDVYGKMYVKLPFPWNMFLPAITGGQQ